MSVSSEFYPYRFLSSEMSVVSGYTKVPNELLRDSSLTMCARLTWSVLRSHAWQDPECWPGQETLARELGVSVCQVRRYLTELEGAGLVETVQQGRGRPNRYRVPDYPVAPPDRTPMSGLEASDRTPMSVLDRTPMSGPIEKKTQVKKTQRTAPQGRAAHDHASTPAKKLVTDFVNSARAEGLDPDRDLIGRVAREIGQSLAAGDSTDSVREDLDWVVTELLEAGESEDSGHTALRNVFGYTPGRDFKPTVWKRDVGLTAEDMWAQALEAEEAGR